MAAYVNVTVRGSEKRSVVERGARTAPEGDPWLGEARCVAAGRAVAVAGSAERVFLDRAFARVCELEMRRAGAVRSVASTLVHAYRLASQCCARHHFAHSFVCPLSDLRSIVLLLNSPGCCR